MSGEKEVTTIYYGILSNNPNLIVDNLPKFIELYKMSENVRPINSRLQDILSYSIVHNINIFDLLLQYINIDCVDRCSRTLLIRMISDHYSLNYINFVISHTKNINLKDEFHRSAIYLLVENFGEWDDIYEYYKTIDMMLDKGANLYDIKMDCAMGPFWFPICIRDIVMLKFILDRSNFSDDILFDCISRSYYDGIELALKYISDINNINRNGDTVLSYAIKNKCSNDIIDLLVENDARL